MANYTEVHEHNTQLLSSYINNPMVTYLRVSKQCPRGDRTDDYRNILKNGANELNPGIELVDISNNKEA